MIRPMEQPLTVQAFARLLFQYRKQAGVYALSFLIMSLNICFFLQANLRTPAAEKNSNMVQLCCFALMGILNCWMFYRRNFLAGLSVSGAKLAFICLLFLIIASSLFVYYWIAGNNSLIMAFASSGAFLLPLLVYQGWITFGEIPAKQYALWRLTAKSAEQAHSSLAGGNNLQLQLLVKRGVDHVAYNKFPVTTARKMKLGRVFEKFVDEQEGAGKGKAIETTDVNGSFGWQFFEQQWGGLYNRNLNPLKSLLDNNIKPNAKIIVKRIPAGTN